MCHVRILALEVTVVIFNVNLLNYLMSCVLDLVTRRSRDESYKTGFDDRVVWIPQKHLTLRMYNACNGELSAPAGFNTWPGI